MAKLEALGPFALVSTKGRKACGAGKSSLLKLACISIVFCVVAASAQTFKVLKSFNGSDGVAPEAPLIQATDGNFYGTTAYGGDSGCRVNRTFSGCGTVFKITPGGTLTTLHSFDGADGAYPSAGLVQAIDGNFYGTTSRRRQPTAIGSARSSKSPPAAHSQRCTVSTALTATTLTGR